MIKKATPKQKSVDEKDLANEQKTAKSSGRPSKKQQQEMIEVSRDELEQLMDRLEELQSENENLQDREKRVLADYKNLVRRNQEDRSKLIKMAGREAVENLLQPFEHLEMAAAQLDDAGLNMVSEQFKQSLRNLGLEEIDVMGQEFNLDTMEVVEKEGEAGKVVRVMKKGYRLNGDVIQHAKVVLG